MRSCNAMPPSAPIPAAPKPGSNGHLSSTPGSFPAAADCYQQVLVLEPGNAQAHAGLAGLAARDGDPLRARQHGEAALAADPDNALAATALAGVELEAGNAAAARDLLSPLATKPGHPSSERVQLLTTYGDALARCRDANTAFAAYSEAQAAYVALYEPPPGTRETHRDLIRRITAEVCSAAHAAWHQPAPPAPPEAAARHVFLLGYPRSGTTLVENVLASLPLSLHSKSARRWLNLTGLFWPNLVGSPALPDCRRRTWRALSKPIGTRSAPPASSLPDRRLLIWIRLRPRACR